MIQPVLYTDPQTEEPKWLCRICGEACEEGKEICPECEEEP